MTSLSPLPSDKPVSDERTARMALTVHHGGTRHSFALPENATVEELSSVIAKSLNIPVENQKFLISPKPGLLKPPFPSTRLADLVRLDSPRLKFTLLGSASKEIESLNAQGEETKRRAEARASARASAAAASKRPTRSTRGVHTLASSSSSNNYTFHRLLPLDYLPNPSRSQTFLARLRDDPGIRAAMAKHGFSVPLLTEMDPIEHTTMSSRTLGLNRNKGEAIELRLRTDAYDGYRDYRTIRKTLCHELAHCVHSEHDSNFWALTSQIEKEVEAADYNAHGKRLTDEEFYDPGDWERASREDEVDEKGWTGGEFVLGGVRNSVDANAGDAAERRREILAKAAEERLRKEKPSR